MSIRVAIRVEIRVAIRVAIVLTLRHTAGGIRAALGGAYGTLSNFSAAFSSWFLPPLPSSLALSSSPPPCGADRNTARSYRIALERAPRKEGTLLILSAAFSSSPPPPRARTQAARTRSFRVPVARLGPRSCTCPAR